MSTLVALVTIDTVIRQSRVQHFSGKHAIRHDEAVHDNDHPQLGCPQHTPHGSYHLKATEITGNIFGSAISLIILHTTLQYIIFMLDTFF